MTDVPITRRINFLMDDPNPDDSAKSLRPQDFGPRPALTISAAVLAAMVFLALFRNEILQSDMAGLRLFEWIAFLAHGGLQDMLVLSGAGLLAFGISRVWRPRLVARIFTG